MLSWAMQWLRPYRAWVAVALVLSVAVIATGSGLMVASGRLLSEAALRPPILDLILIVTAVRFFALSRAALRYLERLVAHDVTFRMLKELRVWLYERLLRRAPSELGFLRGGDMLTRLTGDIDNLQNLYIRILAPAMAALAVAGLTVAALAAVDPLLAAAVGGVHAVAGLAVPLVIGRLSRRPADRRQRLRARFAARAGESFAGRWELAGWDLSGRASRRLHRLTDLDDRLSLALHRLTAWQEGLLAILTWTGLLIALAVGIPLVQDGRLSGVMLAALALGVMATFEGVTALASAIHLLGACRASADRVAEWSGGEESSADYEPVPAHHRHELADGGAAVPSGNMSNENVRYRDDRGAHPPLPPGPLRLSLNGISAGYGARRVLDGVTLELGPGRAVAVVGPNGSGKSTLARVITRMCPVEAGVFTANGVDAAAVDPDQLRLRMAVASQGSHLFLGDVRDHFRIAAPAATEIAMAAALETVELTSWFGNLPEGFDTRLGEGGASVSGGEGQRLALARALVRPDALLVLDEPLNHVDPDTADRILRRLLARVSQVGGLMISHRLQALEGFDEILVLDGGKVVQRGRFDQLAAEDGLFRRMLEVEQDVVTDPTPDYSRM